MLVIYRTHSQTLGLFREDVDKRGQKSWVVLEVGHVHDEKKIKEWRRKGAR
jgi:hypothetical protein